MGKIRGTHSSPGIYSSITDLQYAANSLGITTLGLVGETKKGPAFEPVAISNWSEFQDYFGGTSPEKFEDSKMPKYELPYIAKSYLSASDQMYVCRVLGLSGYNAGPAWALYGIKEGDTQNKYLIGILRSRGSYNMNIYSDSNDKCNKNEANDKLNFYCSSVAVGEYEDAWVSMNCGQENATIVSSTTTNDGLAIVNANNYGKFTLLCNEQSDKTYEYKYAVSLNDGDKNYIYNVLGSNPSDGKSLLFVEALYDLELARLIENNEIDHLGIEKVENYNLNSICEPVVDFLHIPSNKLTRKDLGKTFLCDFSKLDSSVTYEYYDYYSEDGVLTTTLNTTSTDITDACNGNVFIVSHVFDSKDNTKKYAYIKLLDKTINDGKLTYSEVKLNTYTTASTYVDVVKVLSKDAFHYFDNNGIVILQNIGNYREQFRHAVTPWFVSELKGDAKNIEMNKLFRFHTISDGNVANEEVKVTIANVRPDDGTFDVLIRDFNDSDANQIILESYRGVNMIPGNAKYIGLKVGTLNGDYERKSKYVLVEVNENENTQFSVPCGFMGYPVGKFSNLIIPSFNYNKLYDENVNANKQCFGLSDITGIDTDMLYYKGYDAYITDYNSETYTNGFHLDSNLEVFNGNDVKVKVDGEEVMGWTTVSINNITGEGYTPTIGSENQMMGTIYENVKVRKFTACFYGGFDGWDIYRGSRTNTDEFRANKYKGLINNGYGTTFSKIQDGDGLNLDVNAITSDYYAYLAGYKQFENPEKYVINLFATPGIDYVNNKLLTDDVLEMIHNRQDTFYVVTTPDKPYGASESIDEMYSPSDVVGNLEDSNLDTYYASTYYPWVRYYDAANAMYISLPVTKDVLRNMANIDNKKYPWYAPAGIERGSVDCTRARIYTKIEDEDTVYDGRINPVKTFSVDGVKIWGNKTLYSQDTPMNRVNSVRLVLYMRKLIIESTRSLIFEQNDSSLRSQFDGIIRPILNQIKSERGITDFRLITSQTPEQMDAHEISAKLHIKPVPSLEYIELNFVVTPQGVQWDE